MPRIVLVCSLAMLSAVGCSSDPAAPATTLPDTTISPADIGIPSVDLPPTLDLPGDTDPVEQCVDFGQPCTGNVDCACGFCVEGPQGHICSQPCVEECPSGFLCKQNGSTSTDIFFVCTPAQAKPCLPCLDDAQCHGGSCTTFDKDGGSFCTPACGQNGTCDPGFTCTETDDGGTTCMPDTGSCTCGPESDGAKRTCSVANDSGTCVGFETCDGVQGWIECTAPTPADEVCDGVDNDCNGLIDDGLPETQACDVTNDAGTCAGQQRCLGQAGWICDAATPSVEVCDFIDNDCDGSIDTPFVTGIDDAPQYTTSAHCGTCGNQCEGKFQGASQVACDTSGTAPTCVITACQPGLFQLSPFQCIVPPDAVCKPCVNDGDCFGNECIEVLGATYCAPQCDAGACPDGLT